MKRFEVSAKWMKACGYAEAPKVFDVVRIDEYPWAGEGFRKMISIQRDDGSPWMVAELRGKFIP